MDIWSAACILAEMLTEKVLFPGHDSILTHAAHYVMTCGALGDLGDIFIYDYFPNRNRFL